MSRPQRALGTVLTALAGLIAIHECGPQGLYSFGGRGHLLFEAQRALVLALCLTHVGLCLIMWAQREAWDTAEGSIFRFIAVKALFWGFLAVTLVERPGISLSTTYLFVLILFSTLDLDVQIVRRYLIDARDEAADARFGDRPGTSRRRRAREREEA